MKKVGTMSESDVFKTYTLEEFDALPRKESWNYELIDGIILMSPRPSLTHQRIAWNIYFELRQALIGTLCHPIQSVASENTGLSHLKKNAWLSLIFPIVPTPPSALAP